MSAQILALAVETLRLAEDSARLSPPPWHVADLAHATDGRLIVHARTAAPELAAWVKRVDQLTRDLRVVFESSAADRGYNRALAALRERLGLEK